jgi:D-serine deaminase-like pyridoxal phosphate-dependent protein
MKQHNASLIGKPGVRDRIHTPALGVDLDIMEQNMRALREIATAHNIQVRPHAKAHKSPQIAGMQIAHDAVGICCATIGEAEVMAAGGPECAIGPH